MGVFDDEGFVIVRRVIRLDEILVRVLAEGGQPRVITGDVSISLGIDGRLIEATPAAPWML